MSTINMKTDGTNGLDAVNTALAALSAAALAGAALLAPDVSTADPKTVTGSNGGKAQAALDVARAADHALAILNNAELLAKADFTLTTG